MTDTKIARRKSRHLNNCAVTCLALLLAVPAFAALTELGREHGVPSQQIHAVTQGGDGRIYLAGPAGLTVYDGQRTTVLGTEQGLSSHGLRTTVTRNNGLLVVGGDAGVDLQQPDGSFVALGDVTADGASWEWGFAEDLLVHPDGSVWIAAARGLLRWDPESSAQAVETPLIGMNLVSVIALEDRTVWAAGPSIGLLRGNGDTWGIPGVKDWQDVGNIEALAVTSSGTLLVGGEFGLVEINVEGRALRRLLDPSGRGRITALATSAEEVWAGLGSSLVRLSLLGTSMVVVEELATGVLVNDIYEDDIGSIWVATDNRSVVRVSALRALVQSPSPPCAAAVMAVRRAESGKLLVAGDLCSWTMTGNDSERFEYLDGTKAWDLLDYNNSTWFATDAGLVQLTAGQPTVRHGVGNQILDAAGRALAEVGDELWVGTIRGIVRGNGDGRWEELPVLGNDAPGYVYTIVPVSANEAWVGTIGEGVWHWDGRQLQRADISGLPQRGNAYAIALAPGERMAISQDDRIYMLDHETARAIPRVGSDSVAAWSLQFADNYLWAGSGNGLLQIDADSGLLVHRFTSGLGMAADEFTTSRSLLVEGEQVHAATAKGISILQPDAIVKTVSPPKVTFSGIAWRNAEPADGSVNYGNWTAEVHFYAPWFYDERELRFRYRLSGFDDNWVDVGSLPVAHFTALPAGNYSLIAQAYSPLTDWGPEATVWTITVRPPWWQHPLAILAYCMVTLLFIVVGVRWRTHVISVRNSKLEQAVDERTAELASANDDLARLNIQKDRMVSVVAHDLRTPMSVVEMYATLLEQESAASSGPRPPEVGKAISALQRVARQGLNVIDSMLNLQSIESGRAALKPSPVNLVMLLQDAKSQIGELAANRKQINVSVSSDMEVIEVECDSARIRQVISNLISNSIKFSAAGSKIILHAQTETDGATIRVQDYGAGIADDELDKIFKPFTRSSTVPVNNQLGLGIGLTICRMLIEQHGGKVSIESQLGEGTTVSFFLPSICADVAHQASVPGF